MKFSGLLFTLLSGSFLVSCAQYQDVRPGARGVHEVSFTTEREQDGYQHAFNQAKNFCQDRYQLYPSVVDEYSEYIGTMEESAYNQAKTVSKVVETAGIAGIFLGGGERDRDLGTVAALGGGIADGVIGEGYRFTLHFTCD